MGPTPILSEFRRVTIGIMLNFNGPNFGPNFGVGTCEQAFIQMTTFLGFNHNIRIFMFNTVVIYWMVTGGIESYWFSILNVRHGITSVSYKNSSLKM